MTDLILLKNWIETTIEIWKSMTDVVGYDISNRGYIRSYWKQGGRGTGNGRGIKWHLQTTPQRILKPRTDKDGYLVLGSGTFPQYRVHRLVAMYFLQAPTNPKQDQVNHINNIPYDNRHENLEWCTTQENHKHAELIESFPKGEKHHKAKFTEEDVRVIRATCVTWTDCKKVAPIYGCTTKTISNIVRRQTWVHL